MRILPLRLMIEHGNLFLSDKWTKVKPVRVEKKEGAFGPFYRMTVQCDGVHAYINLSHHVYSFSQQDGALKDVPMEKEIMIRKPLEKMSPLEWRFPNSLLRE